jgi:glycerate 2-kinase
MNLSAWQLPAEEQEARANVWPIIKAALAAVDPGEAVRRQVQRSGATLRIGDRTYQLDDYKRVLVIGGGKAGVPMAAALAEILQDRLADGLVVVKRGHVLAERIGAVEVVEAGHPLPDEAGVQGAGRMVSLLEGASEGDLVICVISGGGSALMTLPVQGISLADLRALTGKLLACGATIGEINAVRKHCSRIKGGQLARLASPATLLSLILSDVVGNPLDVIASGPTVPDPTTYDDAYRVLEKYGVVKEVPASIVEHLQAGMAGRILETPKPGDSAFARVQNLIVGSNELAAQAAMEEAERLGFKAMVLSTFIEGEAREVAKVFAGLAKGMAWHDQPLAPPACLVAGGETTVTLRGQGKGGRNQELALAAALALEGWEKVMVVSLATDGNDGPTEAAGAFASGTTVARGQALGLSAQAHLENNDSYAFFAALGDLVLTGPTNTNVNDLIFTFAF